MARSLGPALVLFRDDLRVADHPALAEAAAGGRPVLALYVLDEESPGLRALGGASKWWLAGSLRALDEALRARGGALHLARGPVREIVGAVAAALKPELALWSRRYGGAERAVDEGLEADLRTAGVEVRTFNGTLLREPGEVRGKSGRPPKIFSPYWRAALALGDPSRPLPAPERIAAAALPEVPGVRFLTVDDLALEPTKPDWAGGMRAEWTRGEEGARARLAYLTSETLRGYATRRSRPDLHGSSRLSPHLRFGEISPRTVWHAAHDAGGAASEEDVNVFVSELGWRDFSYLTLFDDPRLGEVHARSGFERLAFRSDRGEATAEIEAWRRGRTGYPIVDAGMRQLWALGWMHNRVRMLTASFLCKHLLVDWRVGEAFFWDTLCDADPANNAMSWQWIAGTGIDSAPFFRIFAPAAQAEKFDPAGDYVRQWVPELARLPGRAIHQPWKARPKTLDAAGVRLGETYPAPIVQHEAARARALAAFKAMREAGAEAA